MSSVSMGLVSSPKHKGLLENPSMKKPNMEKNMQIVDLEGGGFWFPPTTGKGTTKNDAISVEQYCEERGLELAIRASLLPSQNFIDLDSYDDDLSVLNFKPDINPRPRKKPFVYPSVTELGESSNSESTAAPASPPPPPPPPFVCEICAEPKSQNESFKIKGCSHYYCTECVAKFITTRLQENITAIHCPVPNCSGLLEPEYCRRILPPEVFNRWGDALCEAVILGSQRFYCPYMDCSALLIIDDGVQQVRESICPNCFRLLCAQCKVPWHSEIQCEEFQKLHKDEREREDIMLLKLAQQKMWARCPKCRSVVEKTHGCDNIYCRCGTNFRYDTQRCK